MRELTDKPCLPTGARYRMAGMLLCACLLLNGCGEERSGAPEQSNWHRHNRTEDFLAYNYGYNLLMSCEPNAVLLTQGDNDTFPLWYLQQVEGFRRDVCVVNLSLLNTPWYIRQLRDRPGGVALDMSDEFIDRRLSGGPGAFRVLRWTVAPSPVSAAGITWELPPDQVLTDDIGIITVAHYVLIRIIDTVSWSRPLYVSSAVAPVHFIGLDGYLSCEGLVYRLTPQRSPDGVIRTDVARITGNLARYRFDGLTGDGVYRSPDTERILGVYFDVYAALAEAQVAAGAFTSAANTAQTARMLVYEVPGRASRLDKIMDKIGDRTAD